MACYFIHKSQSLARIVTQMNPVRIVPQARGSIVGCEHVSLNETHISFVAKRPAYTAAFKNIHETIKCLRSSNSNYIRENT
jgi:hypothetical protein